MTGDAILEIAHALTTVNRRHGVAGMFVTAEARVFPEVPVRMANRTGDIVARVQFEKF